MKTSSLPPSEPAADRAIDALLHEHARLHTQDDEDFLAKFEQLLAKEPDAPSASPPTLVTPIRSASFSKVAALAAAACVCIAFFIQHETGGAKSIVLPNAPDAKLKGDLALLATATEANGYLSDDLPSFPPPEIPQGLTSTPMARNSPTPARHPSPRLSKSGSGTFTISGSNTYTGGLTLGAAATDTVAVIPKPMPPASIPSDPRNKAEREALKQRIMEEIGSRQRDGMQSTDQPTTRGDHYTPTPPNPFRAVTTEPLSTLSVDVDTASYANLRRILQSGGSVPPEAVRIEEMINYFPYHYEEPKGEHPFSLKVESASCPWDPSHRLVKIALKAKEMDRSKRASANLVFLIDVSGSMQGEDRLGLVVENLRVLTKALLPDDTVAIVTYAGSEGLALPPTSGADKATILAKLDSLGAGGSTNGGAGITLAYSTAQSRLLKEGINRVILCTDGDFNVGATSETSLVDLVAAEAKKGVFLTVCGYGSGNLNDSMMEAITNKGNGVYHYIDSAREGRKVFQDELLGTLFTVAKDVKLQIEFNPQHAAQYRLIGYDNRMLVKEDFANDKVDAGDIGAGHRVTALYEVIPVGASNSSPIPLKYQQPAPPAAPTDKPSETKPANPELLTVKLRHKEPTADVSKPFDVPFVEDPKASPSADLSFAATVAEFGERLRGHVSPGRTIDHLIETAESARGDDPHGHRAEFIELMRKSAK